MAAKIAMVTGAGTGVGKAAALALVKDGWNVVLTGRRIEPLEEVAAMAEKGRMLAVPTDVTDDASIENAFKKTIETYGRLDLLFNNAGRGAPAIPIEDLPAETFREVVATNLTAIFICTQHAFRIMKDQSPRGGRIINNGSISAHAPRPFSIAYTSTKHAVTGLTKSTSLDGRAYDIACGQIDIGNADTAMGGRMKAGVPQADGSVRAEAVMDPDLVGKAVAQMAALPLEANVQFMTIMATKMPFVGRG
ncbi:SDR family oxidoreductase [Enterovirga rhinocerotis]|uniref:NADP-dependent 3-hydroxy acid dehydrogenase YdfG n=1 Tax=Enterovirga rhinocerotis TaxID=1339210 RepID=A0A4R7C927_9HYPH|nr:SDR family oxidoreductase [Enterovirga rhinocerotis]TDR94512.1 NADP-dependent 3-hydroxy acid dehydrogenase YdfG [Enterovirga rhinocerotis]